MKKPLVIRKPRPLENNRSTGSGFEKIGDILNKLEPQQIISLTDSLTNFASAGFEYLAECQKTRQIEINAHVRIRDIDAGLQKAYLEHEQVMAKIQSEDRNNKHQFVKDMQNLKLTADELERKDNNIHHILDLLEAGEISEDKLVDIIHGLKQ
jgi:hypothetical protein